MTRHGTRHLPTRWLSLFTMFKAVEGLGADHCLAASWIFLSEQGDETASDRNCRHIYISLATSCHQFKIHVHLYSSQAGEPVNSFLGSLLSHDTVSRFIKGEERRQVF